MIPKSTSKKRNVNNSQEHHYNQIDNQKKIKRQSFKQKNNNTIKDKNHETKIFKNKSQENHGSNKNYITTSQK